MPEESFDSFQPFVVMEDEDIDAIRDLRIDFRNMQLSIEGLCPTGRARSCAIKDLESAAMWAIKAIVIEGPMLEHAES